MALVVLSQSARADYVVGDLRNYDLVTLKDFTGSSDVEGRSIIGGNLNGTGNYATQLNKGANATVDTLVVVGNVNGTANLDAGSALVGGSILGTVNRNGGPGSTVTAGASLSNVLPTITSDIDSASMNLGKLAANSTITGLPSPGSQPMTVNFNVAPVNGVAVFTIDGSVLANSDGKIQSISLTNAGAASSIIINVTGSGSITDMVNLTGDFQTLGDRHKILWNFEDATNVNLQRELEGSLLAPMAAVTNNTPVNGSAFVDSFTATGEVHFPISGDPSSKYDGIFPVSAASVPEPASLALLALGSGLILRRKARKVVA